MTFLPRLRSPPRGAVLLVAFLLCAAPAARGAKVRALGLADMAGRAGRIFAGRCTGRTVAQDPTTGIPVTTYMFAVTEPIKGVGPGPTRFRVPGTPERPLITGIPVFQVGEEALILLYPESPAGFATAMGLDQGQFRFHAGGAGSPWVVNGHGNQGLFRDVPLPLLAAQGLARGRSGPVDLEALVGVLRGLVARGRP